MAEKAYNLHDDMVKMVQYPAEIQESVEQLAGLWEGFCELPIEVKNRFAATNAQLTQGYEIKNGKGVRADIKENFDVSSLGIEALAAMSEQVGNTTARQFIHAIPNLQQQMIPMIEAFGGQVENDYGVEGFAELARRSAQNAYCRFLHYLPGEEGDVIAQPHVDHSGFTFHLYETTAGCNRLTSDGEWQSLPVAHGQAVAFPGMQLQLVSSGKLKAMAHEVVANTDSARIGRYAIVCFVSLADTPVYDRETYGRLQEKEPGFNYTEPPHKFRQLFRQP
jgi:isopenicillin N synthase-like dioxygenase